MNKTLSLNSLLVASLALSACGAPSTSTAPASGPELAVTATAPQTTAAREFMNRLSWHCGKAYAGRVIKNVPAAPDDPFEGKPIVMHVRDCGEGEIRIALNVGDDRSRIWRLGTLPDGLRLKHDHRHGDGSEDAVTMYGGDTRTPGTETRQEFPVDEESIALFKREGLEASITNTWAMELDPGKRFLYELSRPNGRLFQLEFDLTTPVAEPPPPWAYLPVK